MRFLPPKDLTKDLEFWAKGIYRKKELKSPNFLN
jgi:hypothetical protein